MKKIQMCVIIALIAFVSTALAEQTWVEFEKGMRGTEPRLTVLESSFSGTTINLKTHGMWVEDVKEGKETYQRITLAASHTGEVGKPMLPVIRKLVAIPATAGVTVKVKSKKETVLEDYLVYPFQHPEPVPESMRGFEIDEDFYELDTLYPVELSEVGAPGIMNQVRLVQLSIHPFRYNPKTKELRVVTDLTIHLDYSGFDERNALKGMPTSFFPQWERLYRSLLLNFDDIYHPVRIDNAVPFTQMPKYLIIYANKFRPAVNPVLDTFIEWKKRKGLWVEAVNLDSIIPPANQGDTSNVNDVRDYIVDWYDTTHVHLYPYHCYVLLVGDAPGFDWNYQFDQRELYSAVQCAYDSLIPTFSGYDYDYDYWEYLFSDYYYQLVSGTDSLPDISLGRWCCRTPEELSIYVDKTMDYEMGGASGWRPDKALYVAYRSDAVGGTSFQDTKEHIADYIYTPACELYADEGATTQDVIDEIESTNSYGIVNYCGHGSKGAWAAWDANHESLTRADVEALDNEGRYPVVYNMCCYNGCITEPSDWPPLVEAWTRNPEGGAAGAFGASLVSWISYSNRQDSAMFRAHFNQYLNCGMAINYGKVFILQYTNRYARDNAWMYYWIGDPEIDVWRGIPEQAYVELECVYEDGTLQVGVYYSSDDMPVSGGKACLYREGGGYHWISYIYAGKAYFPYPTIPGSYHLTATNQVSERCIRPAFNQFTIYEGFGEQGEPLVDMIDWQLKPIYPNPLRSQATISYSVAGRLGSRDAQFVEINVFDVSGRQIKALATGEKPPGHYEVIWNGQDNEGLRCASGIYFIRMNSESFSANERLILLR